MNEETLTREQAIRSEALEQATRIAVKHNLSARDHAKLALKLSDAFADYIRGSSVES